MPDTGTVLAAKAGELLPRPHASRRLIFHIGNHKTGSTSIQTALARGEIMPAGRRILYTAEEAHNYLPKHFRAWAQDGTILSGTKREPGLTALSERLSEDSFDDAIFSAENFEGFDPREFSTVLSKFFLPHVDEHLILCWVRPHAARIVSDYAENLKIGWYDGSMEQFHERFKHDRVLLYADHLSRWQATFKDRFLPRIMVREYLQNQSILDDFVSAIYGDTTPIVNHTTSSANETLSLEDLVTLRHLQQAISHCNRHLRHAFGWELMHLLQQRPGKGTKLRLHKSLAETIRSDYLDDARRLDRGIFATAPVFESELDRAIDEALPKPQSFDPRDHFSAQHLRDLDTMGALLRTMVANTKMPWQPYLVRQRIRRLHGTAVSSSDKHEPDTTRPARAAPADAHSVKWDTLLTYRDILVLPNRKIYRDADLGDGGPLWPEERAELRHFRRQRPIDTPVSLPPDALAKMTAEAKVLDGPHIWGGYAHHRFGHLIAQHMTRIIAARSKRPDDPVLFTLRPGQTPADLPGWFMDVAACYGLTPRDIHFVTEPVIVPELHVAPQAEHLYGPAPDPGYIALVNKMPVPAPRESDILYVARTGMLEQGRGAHAGERYLVSLLRDQGVPILDPATAPLEEQLAAYGGARRLIIAEGSALHGRQLLGYRPQHIVVLMRLPKRKTARNTTAPRVDRLDYAKVITHRLLPSRLDGQTMPSMAASIYDVPALLDTFLNLGIDLRPHWDQTAYMAARDADIRSWIAGLPKKVKIDERTREDFLSAGLGPPEKWMTVNKPSRAISDKRKRGTPDASSPDINKSRPDAMLTLQRLILPDPAITSQQALYVHAAPAVIVDGDHGEIWLPAGEQVWFDSYMNLFSLDLWARTCALGGLWFELSGKGRVHLRLWRLERAGGREQVLLDRVITLDPEGVEFELGSRLDLGPGATGVLILRLTALDDARVSGGRWLAPRPARPRDLQLALSITTFRREAEVGASVARITSFLEGDGAALIQAAGCRAHLFVVDNGQSVMLPPHPLLTVIPNTNLGGAGGFARGLAAAADAGFTHCLFMDDDAAIEMESLVRTISFLQLARSDRAAVAGAMISAGQPWMMWENGAVFDRSCRPQFIGTDLRDGPTVIRMLAAAAKPKPAGFYAGWWFFAFPLAGVRHYPFPFFVRGDDISFSLTHDFETATINGVVSFQEDFSVKESPQTLYLDLRNHLHHHLVQREMELGANGTARIALWFFFRSIVRMHYDSAAAQLMAWEDIMRGPEFFASNADMTQRRKDISALTTTEKWEPITSDDLAVGEMSHHPPTLRYGQRMKLMLNGHLIPFWGLTARRVRIPASHRGLIWPLWGVKEAVFVNESETRSYRVKHSKRRAWALIWRAGRLYLRWWRNYPEIRDAHRRGYVRLTTRAFWDGKFLHPATPGE